MPGQSGSLLVGEMPKGVLASGRLFREVPFLGEIEVLRYIETALRWKDADTECGQKEREVDDSRVGGSRGVQG
jgi:hypothetical protein